jgi:pimeloyl-ACP methyl ester carboxylesterase
LATFVLVHGAWHGGWCWERVARLLRHQGHSVHAPTLTGVCERSHLASADIDLATHITDVANEIRWKELEDIVLVGHSYGGMVVTGLAEQCADRISSIVYLDAFLPNDGQSLYDIVGSEHPSSDGMVDPLPAEFFAVNEKDRAWVDRMTTAQSEATFSQPLQVTGLVESIGKKTYVRALQGAIPPFAVICARLEENPTWRCLEIDCGHDVMIDQPDEIARILCDAA